MSHSHPKTVAYFADLDAQLARTSHPDFAVIELEDRILNTERCKRHLAECAAKGLKLPAYSAFDLAELDAGLHGRLVDAKAALAAARIRDAAPMSEAA